MRKPTISLHTVLFMLCSMLLHTSHAQDGGQAIVLSGATIHTGAGTVIENGTLIMQGGRITYVGTNTAGPGKNGKVIDVKGKHLYPGLVALCNYAGLSEIDAARPTRDYAEVGVLNPHIRSAPAYNCDSRILPTLVYNGVLLNQPAPQSGLVAGTSSLMRTRCGNWADGLAAADVALHINWPEYNDGGHGDATEQRKNEQMKQVGEQLLQLKTFFAGAQHYAGAAPAKKEVKFEAAKDIFTGKRKVFVHAAQAASIIDAVLFFKPMGVAVVWVGARDVLQATAFLKEHNIPVVLQNIHRLPSVGHSATDEAFALPAQLQKAGVSFCLSLPGSWEVRNLAFIAGTACAYGLGKEEALAAICSSPAKMLGLDAEFGSLQEGKQAYVLVCDGDLLDMQQSKIEQVYMAGVEAALEQNPQYQLYRKYTLKYWGE